MLFLFSLVTSVAMENPSLVDLLNSNLPSDCDENFDFLGNSPYQDDSEFANILDQNPNGFFCLSTNIQSLRKNHNELVLQLDHYNQHGPGIAVLLIQETWFGPEHGRSHIDILGYNCLSKFYSSTIHGGLATYIRADLRAENVPIPTYSGNLWECIFVEIYGQATAGRKIVVGNVYRPPRERVELLDRFINEFMIVLESLQHYDQVYTGGDYNIDMFKCNSDFRINQYMDMCFSSSYFPKILYPTRMTEHSATLIDNFLCKFSSTFGTLHSGILTNRLSDHQPYYLMIDSPVSTNRPQPTYHYTTVMTHDAKLAFKQQLGETLTVDQFDSSPASDPEIAAANNLNILNESISESHKKHFKKKRIRSDRRKNPKNPWITKALIKSIRTRNKLYKKLKKMTDTEDERYQVLKLQLKNFKKILRRTIKMAKKKHYTQAFERIKGDSRKTWSLINSLTNKSSNSNKLPDHFIVDGQPVSDPKTIANELNSFFLNIADNITSDIDEPTETFESYLGPSKPKQFSFKEVNSDTIGKAIDSLKCKRTLDCDGLTTELIKLCKFELLDPLKLIINQCIRAEIFPDSLKIARVSAIHKKGDTHIFDNYRPISILPVLSKIFERILHIQLTEYFTENKLFYDGQYGFRQNHSTEYAALELTDYVMQNLENRKHVFSIFMDLSKAFDCLNHDILMTKLSNYGLENSSLNLIRNYLSNRKQYVEINNIQSEFGSINIGVPQGSILGPLLFIIYINDIANASPLLSSILYADDSTFSTCIDNLPEETIDETISAQLDNVHNWLRANRLCLNVKKTKYMIFSRTKHTDEHCIQINHTNVERVNEFNFLGLTIKENLDWDAHINGISRKLSCSIGILRRLSQELPSHVLTTLYYSLIHSHLTYMLLAWGYDSKEIFLKQKAAIRLIHNKHYLSHTDPLFKDSKILKVEDIHTQAQLKFCHKYVNGQLPTYFGQMELKTNSDNHTHWTRQHDELINARPGTEGGRKCIRNSIPKLVNGLSPKFNDALYTQSCRYMRNMFKYDKLESYSSRTRCTDTGCYSCSVVFS